MIAMLNRRALEQDGRFVAAREFGDGRSALRWLLEHPADLVLLDVYMPAFTGLELLQELRAQGVGADVIMVTAANDRGTLDQLLKLGVVDYLVKPFTRQRFQQALDTFCAHRQALAAGGSVSQSEIDRLLHTTPASAGQVPKGLQERTLELVRACLSGAPGQGRTSEEIAGRVGLSAVTVRRYLHYMTEGGEAESSVNYDTGGRPCILYRPAGRSRREKGPGAHL